MKTILLLVEQSSECFYVVTNELKKEKVKKISCRITLQREGQFLEWTLTSQEAALGLDKAAGVCDRGEIVKGGSVVGVILTK